MQTAAINSTTSIIKYLYLNLFYVSIDAMWNVDKQDVANRMES